MSEKNTEAPESSIPNSANPSPEITHWNCRVVHHRGYFTIREVYYGKDGSPMLWSENPEYPGGENLNDLRGNLHQMIAALDKPILEAEELPGYKPVDLPW